MIIKRKSLLTVLFLTIITFALVSCAQNVSSTVYFNSNGGSEVNSITQEYNTTLMSFFTLLFSKLFVYCISFGLFKCCLISDIHNTITIFVLHFIYF